MVSVCFYFQVHQPYRLGNYSVFDIGKNMNYFDSQKNKAILNKVAEKCYLPTNKIMLDLIKQYPEFKISYSLSGVILDQFQEYNPDVLRSFQTLVDTGNVEILDETYYHSLAFLQSKEEFKEQINLHTNKIKKLFKLKPTIFRNTELIYNNELAKYIEDLGYKGIIAEGADHILGWRSPNFIYTPKNCAKLKLLLKNYRLSDDIAFRFSDKGWKEYPLTADKFTHWVNGHNGSGHCINLFMDYETFGEHQWQETGIFEFLKHIPQKILKHPDNNFKTPSELIKTYTSVGELDIHNLISWADIERDTSAWLGNNMQRSAINNLYQLEKGIKSSNDKQLIELWRRMQTSDNFYYMCTKWFNDGDVHKYFNPYNSPHEGFIAFMNAINDLKMRVNPEIRCEK
jgi:alpha-amylase